LLFHTQNKVPSVGFVVFPPPPPPPLLLLLYPTNFSSSSFSFLLLLLLASCSSYAYYFRNVHYSTISNDFGKCGLFFYILGLERIEIRVPTYIYLVSDRRTSKEGNVTQFFFVVDVPKLYLHK
jgi:hypothetical protein